MRSLKILLLTACCTLSLFTLVLHSCVKDHCRDMVCHNGGVCDEGFCQCPSGYAGAHCEYNKCEGINCLNGGSCFDGKCQCLPGFEGPNCEFLSRNKFMGSWSVTEDGTSSPPAQYALYVSNGSSAQEVRISNFHNSFAQDAKGLVTGDTLVLPLQGIGAAMVEGRGLLMDDPVWGAKSRLELRYRLSYLNGDVDDFGWQSGSPSVWLR